LFDLPSATLVIRARKLNLHAVHAVDTVNEQDQDEDERDLGILVVSLADAALPYLHAILQLCYYRALRDEAEELAAPCKRQRDDQGAEDEHLRHQKEEDLEMEVSLRPHIAFVKEIESTRAMREEVGIVISPETKCFYR
jgi:hypothetical protein